MEGGRGEEGANVPLLLITPPDGWEEGRRAGKQRGGREHEANGPVCTPPKKKKKTRREEKLQQEVRREETGSGWKKKPSVNFPFSPSAFALTEMFLRGC